MSRKLTSIFGALLGCACGVHVASACDAQVDPLGPRFRIQFFQYAGAEDGEARNQNSRFRAVISDKVIAWSEELRGPTANAALPELELIAAGADTLTSATALQQYWLQTHSLELFKGVLEPAERGGYGVRSRIYLGDLGAPLQTKSVLVSMKIAATEMANTMDAHSIVTYFALAMDLQRRRCDRAVVAGVLSKVQEKLADLKRRGSVDPVLTPINQATDRLLRQMAATR